MALPLGILLGLAIAVLYSFKHRWLNIALLVYIDLFRSFPVVVLLILIYFGLPFLGFTLGGFTAAVLAIVLNNSGYFGEIFRAGILSVPRGQAEAAATVGLTGVRAAVLITLPQALRVALPAAGGQYQTLAKASSLAAAIGYPDIMQIGGTVASQTSQALEAMTLVVVLYAAINLLIALAVGLANRRLLAREGR